MKQSYLINILTWLRLNTVYKPNGGIRMSEARTITQFITSNIYRNEKIKLNLNNTLVLDLQQMNG